MSARRSAKPADCYWVQKLQCKPDLRASFDEGRKRANPATRPENPEYRPESLSIPLEQNSSSNAYIPASADFVDTTYPAHPSFKAAQDALATSNKIVIVFRKFVLETAGLCFVGPPMRPSTKKACLMFARQL
jgi:hypothetical protein